MSDEEEIESIDGHEVNVVPRVPMWNLTPHDIVIVANGVREVIPKRDISLRCDRNTVGTWRLGEINVVQVAGYATNDEEAKAARDALVALGAKAGDVILVSTIAADALIEGDNALNIFRVLVPDSSPAGAIRDEKGNIVGVNGLVEYVF